MTVQLRHYWLSLGLFTEGRRWHDRALARAADLAQELHDRDLRAHVTDAQAIASFFAGDLQTAGARHENALAEYAEIGFSDRSRS
jgi:hypothetical protein